MKKKLLPLLLVLFTSYADAQLYSKLLDSVPETYLPEPINTNNHFYLFSHYNDYFSGGWDTLSNPNILYRYDHKSEKLKRVFWRKSRSYGTKYATSHNKASTDKTHIYSIYTIDDRFTILKVKDDAIIDSLNISTKSDTVNLSHRYSNHYNHNGKIALIKSRNSLGEIDFYAVDLKNLKPYKFLTTKSNSKYWNFLLVGSSIYFQNIEKGNEAIIRASLSNGFDTTHIANDRFISACASENYIYYRASIDTEQVLIKRFDTASFKVEQIGGLPNGLFYSINILNAGSGVYATKMNKICLNSNNSFTKSFEGKVKNVVSVKGYNYLYLDNNKLEAVDPSAPTIKAKIQLNYYTQETKDYIYTSTTFPKVSLRRISKKNFSVENLSPYGLGNGFSGIHLYNNEIFYFLSRNKSDKDWMRLYKKSLDGIPAKINSFIDYNKNGNFDKGDIQLNNIKLEINGVEGELFGTANTNASIMLNKGIQHLKPSYKNWNLSTDTLISFKLTEKNKDTTINIGVYPDQLKDAIACNISLRNGRCRTKVRLVFLTENTGSTVLNTQLRISLDDSIYIDSFSTKPTRVSNDTFIWDNIRLEPGITNNEFNKIIAFTRFPGMVQLDTGFAFPNLKYSFKVKGKSSNGSATNTHEFRQPLRCSYDPNDKTVFPWNPENNDQTLLDERLTYRIRFQNTGNDTAFHVKIIDTLSENLDWSTLRVLDYSHPMELKVMDDGKRMFLFNNIMLVDSHTNEPASNGFVTFSIDHKKEIKEQTEILNTAYIYFDRNPAILTNTARSVMVSKVVGINEEGSKRKSLDIYPNPATNTITIKAKTQINWIEIYSANGKLLNKVKTENGVNSLNIESLKPGLYMLKAHCVNGTFQSRFIKE